MMRTLSVLLCSLVLSFAVSLPAAGSQAASDDAYVRFLHASPDLLNVDVYVDGHRVLEGFEFQSVSDYASLRGGKHKVELFASGETETPIVRDSFELEPGVAVTAAIAGQEEDLDVALFPDRSGGRGDQASLRLIHLSPNAPEVDVSADDRALFTGIGVLTASQYSDLPAGEVNLSINPSGNPEAPTVSEVALDLEPGKAYSTVLMGVAGQAPGLEVLLLEDGVVPGLPKSGMGGASPIVE
ncbi:hypothetical protein B0W44_16235 [Novibacillus thermophilus]|uniref:DUF4397 domain-containing protein n=2 Tax=Novibacillus thermophilus TaxID=1471761 RepID=A0A1U9KAK8_9BACL|nr:hypothetical protein B0W44_16235 [Novibacillus thermophilus]